MQKRLFGGCDLTRPVVALLTVAGFTITELAIYETARDMGADSLGVALP